MLEILMIVGLVVFASRVAAVENQSEIMWGAITAGLCIASILVLPQLPFLRILIAGAAAFLVWMAYVLLAKR